MEAEQQSAIDAARTDSPDFAAPQSDDPTVSRTNTSKPA
jgi:hypothetical protein